MIAALLSVPAAWAQPSSLVGDWDMTLLRFDGASKDHTRVTVEMKGDKVVGTTARGLKLEIAVHGSELNMRLFDKNGKPQGTWTGRSAGNELSGDGSLDDGKDRFHWTARRPAAVPAGGPRTLQFTPEKFHNYFASNVAPVMHIFPKDTGRDQERGRRRHRRTRGAPFAGG